RRGARGERLPPGPSVGRRRRCGVAGERTRRGRRRSEPLAARSRPWPRGGGPPGAPGPGRIVRRRRPCGRRPGAWGASCGGRTGPAAHPASPPLRPPRGDEEGPAARAGAAGTPGAMGPSPRPAAATLLAALADGVADVRGRAALPLSRLDLREPDVAVPPLVT